MAGRIKKVIRKHLRYPSIARRRGIEGVVIVAFRIETSGRAHSIKVVRSAGFILDQAAVQAVKKARPLPPMPDWVKVPLAFRLDD